VFFTLLIHRSFFSPFAVCGKKKLGILSGSSSAVRFSSPKPYDPLVEEMPGLDGTL